VIVAAYDGTTTEAPSAGVVGQRVDNGTVVSGSRFCNLGAISLPASGAAPPYPSRILASGLRNTLTKVTVSLLDVSHGFGGDVEVLLVGPGGQSLVVVSDAGTAAVSDVTLVLDDGAAAPLPLAGSWAGAATTVTVIPTNYAELAPDAFPAPAPSPSNATTLATFNGTDPNGTWSLYVIDDSDPDPGSIGGGWCLSLAASSRSGLSATASPGVVIGEEITDRATLAGAGTPTGTVTFRLFAPEDVLCSTPVFTSTVPVDGNASYTSAPFTPLLPGTWRWTADYSGDASNAAAATACGDPDQSVLARPGVVTDVVLRSPAGGSGVSPPAAAGRGTPQTRRSAVAGATSGRGQPLARSGASSGWLALAGTLLVVVGVLACLAAPHVPARRLSVTNRRQSAGS
jgi:subtilisin-like proprotein convertase family protein